MVGYDLSTTTIAQIEHDEINGAKKIISGDSASIDGFGRWRTSDTGQRLDVEFTYDKQIDYFDELTTNGTVTHNANTRDLTLSLSDANNGSSAAMFSYPVPYTAGNSQLTEMTGTLDASSLGTGTAEVFLRSSITGSIVDEVITQSNWLSNTTGIDWGTSHIFVIDFQSLKVGRIRFFLNQAGMFNKVAQITNDNIRDAGFWQLPNLPLSYRIYNTATETISEMAYGDENNAVGFRYRMPVNATATMRAICCTVKSEGGNDLRDMSGLSRSIDRGVTAKTVSTTLIPLISIRCRSTFKTFNNLILAIPKEFNALTNQDIKLVLINNTTLTGASWVNVDINNSTVEYDVTATALTGGQVLHTQYMAGASAKNSSSATGLVGKNPLWARRDDISGILTIAAIRTGGTNASVLAGLEWEELR